MTIEAPALEREEVLTFEKGIEGAVENALALVRERYEKFNPKRPHDELEYHNTHHTLGVMRRAKLILETILGANPELAENHTRIVALSQFVAAYHDTVQNYIEIVRGNGILRERDKVNNEKASAEEAIEYLRSKGIQITALEEQQLRGAIYTTTPAFNVDMKTVEQDGLTADASLLTRALALADLGAAGIDGPEESEHEGNAVFREEQIDIKDAIHDIASLPEEQKQRFATRMLEWSKGQVAFIEGRKALLDRELNGLPKEATEAVRALFSRFDESIEQAKLSAETRAKMSFEELVRDFGYSI